MPGHCLTPRPSVPNRRLLLSHPKSQGHQKKPHCPQKAHTGSRCGLRRALRIRFAIVGENFIVIPLTQK